MTSNLLNLFKYYKQEAQCPFPVNSLDALWWKGEKQLYETCINDPEFFDRIKKNLNNALSENACSGLLLDKSTPFDKKAIIFYLDLWHGKNFPYDNLDLIHKY